MHQEFLRIHLPFAYIHLLTAHKSWVLLISMARNKTRRPARLYFRCLVLSVHQPPRLLAAAAGVSGCCRQMAGSRRRFPAADWAAWARSSFQEIAADAGNRGARAGAGWQVSSTGAVAGHAHARRLCDADAVQRGVAPGDAGFLCCARQPPVFLRGCRHRWHNQLSREGGG